MGESRQKESRRGCIPPKHQHRRGNPLPGSCAHSRCQKQPVADTRCKTGPQLPPSPAPEASAPSTARTLSHACPEPDTVPATLSQGIPRCVECYGASPHRTAGKLRQEPLCRAPEIRGQVLLPFAPPRAQGDPGTGKELSLSPSLGGHNAPPALFPLEIWI